jgi:hypothetical protein
MWRPEDLVEAQDNFQEFLESSGQTCSIRRPTEALDNFGTTARSFPTVIADGVPCVVLDSGGSMTFEELADQPSAQIMVEILLPLDIQINQGDQVITESATYSVRRLDDINTHSLVQHVWGMRYGRTA